MRKATLLDKKAITKYYFFSINNKKTNIYSENITFLQYIFTVLIILSLLPVNWLRVLKIWAVAPCWTKKAIMRMTANLKSPLPLHQRLSPYHLVQIGLRHLSFHFRQKVAVQVRLLYVIYKTAKLALEYKSEDKLAQRDIATSFKSPVCK